MSIKPHPFWIAGGFFLAAMAGFVNATSLLGLFHQAISHATGNVTLLSEEIVKQNRSEIVSLLFVLLSFLSGSIISGMVTGSSALKPGRRYGILMVVEGMLLLAAAWLLNRHIMYGEFLASMACGVQNSMATSYSGAVIRTTHMTGILTDIGILLGHLLRYGRAEYWKLLLHGILLMGFFTGGLFGSIFFRLFKFNALYFPAFAISFTGLFYFFWRVHAMKHSHHHHIGNITI